MRNVLDLSGVSANIRRLFVGFGWEKASLCDLFRGVHMRKHRPGTAELLHSAPSPSGCSELGQQRDGGPGKRRGSGLGNIVGAW